MKKKNTLYIKSILILSSLILTFTASGCKGIKQEYSKSGFAFDTVIGISIYDDNKTHADSVLTECINLCNYYDSIFSVSNPESDIYKINNAGGIPVKVSEETIEIIDRAIYYSKLSEGLLDITIEPLYKLWDINASEHTDIPDEKTINKYVAKVNYRTINISYDNNTVSILPGSEITLGALAKGYIADKLKEYLISKEITSGLINLGGNIQAFGSKPDGKQYNIGIQKPFSQNGEIITNLYLTNKSVVTSGTYQRYFEYNNKIYHHIIDPNNGYPANNELASVTIITESSLDADAYSTICMLMGYDKSVEFLNSLNADVSAIFIDNNGNIKELGR